MRAELEIDMYADVEPNGIHRTLYIGESCKPVIETLESWEEIVERTIGYYRIPGDNTIAASDVEEIEKIVAGLENAVKLFREKIKEHDERIS